MAKTLSYKNKHTGKTYQGTPEEIASIKANKVISNNFVYESEVETPAEPKTKAVETAK